MTPAYGQAFKYKGYEITGRDSMLSDGNMQWWGTRWIARPNEYNVLSDAHITPYLHANDIVNLFNMMDLVETKKEALHPKQWNEYFEQCKK